MFLLPVVGSQKICSHCVSCASNFSSWIILKLSFKRKIYLLSFRCAEKFPYLYFCLFKKILKETRVCWQGIQPAYFAKFDNVLKFSSCQQWWILPCALLKTRNLTARSLCFPRTVMFLRHSVLAQSISLEFVLVFGTRTVHGQRPKG